jgi:hypothetical protein
LCTGVLAGTSAILVKKPLLIEVLLFLGTNSKVDAPYCSMKVTNLINIKTSRRSQPCDRFTWCCVCIWRCSPARDGLDTPSLIINLILFEGVDPTPSRRPLHLVLLPCIRLSSGGMQIFVKTLTGRRLHWMSRLGDIVLQSTKQKRRMDFDMWVQCHHSTTADTHVGTVARPHTTNTHTHTHTVSPLLPS